MISEDWNDKKVTVEMSRREMLEVLLSVRNDMQNLSPDDTQTRPILESVCAKLLRCKG